MNEKQLKDAELLYQDWSVAELLLATTAEKQDYEPEALELMARELSRRDVSQSERDDSEREVRQHVATQRMQTMRLTGINGFLLLFVINVLLSALGYALFGLLFLGMGGPSTARGSFSAVLFGVVFLVLAAYGSYVFYVLIRKRRNAPRHAQRMLIFAFLMVILQTATTWAVTHHLNPEALLVGFLGTSLWLAYLSGSQRVANTYAQTQVRAESQTDASTDTA